MYTEMAFAEIIGHLTGAHREIDETKVDAGSLGNKAFWDELFEIQKKIEQAIMKAMKLAVEFDEAE